MAALAVVFLSILALRPVSPPHERAPEPGQRRFARNAITPIATNLADRILFWGFWIVALRLLKPEGNGEYAFALNLLLYFAALVDFGLGTLLTREVARDSAQTERWFRASLALRVRLVAVSVPTMVLVAGIYRLTGTISDVTLATAGLLAAGLVPSAVNQAYASIYGGWERMDRRGLVVAGTSGLTVGLGLVFLGAGLGVLGIALAGLISSAVTFIALARPVGFELLRDGWRAGSEDLRGLARAALPLMLNSLLATAFVQLDILVLQPLQGTIVVGHYNAAYKFINALNVFPAAVVLAAFPLMARTAADPAMLADWFARTWRILITVGAGAVAFLFVFATDLIDALLGPDYLPTSATALAILIWFLPLSYLNGTLQYVLISQDRQWRLAPAFVTTTVFNLALNLALVPAFGFVAAAATTIASEAVLLVILAWLLRNDRINRRALEPAVRPVLAALAFGAIAWPLRDLGLYWVAAAVTAGAGYLAVLLVTRGIRISELREAGAAFTRRTGTG